MRSVKKRQFKVIAISIATFFFVSGSLSQLTAQSTIVPENKPTKTSESKWNTLNEDSPIRSLDTRSIEIKRNFREWEVEGYRIDQEGDWITYNKEWRGTRSIEGLEPATVYSLSVATQDEFGRRDTLFGLPFITRSYSSGEIKVYFNSSVNEEVSTGPAPESTDGVFLRNTILNKIEEANFTIDVAAYNNNRSEIVQALNDAANRGVRVRYIAEGSNANTALNTSTAFEVLERQDDLGIMHHKFLIIDVEDTDNSWVFMGSTNLTTQQIATDNNNALFIQDQGLAVIYEMEFEEMWGSNTEFPNVANSKFGAEKLDNTPHLIMVGDIPVESYFSPSDNTAFHISNALEAAQESISAALLLFTFNPLAEMVIQKHHQGLIVRNLIHDIEANGSRYSKLVSNGVNVHQNSVSGVQLHHKYAIVDADIEEGNPLVITGSHNWTNKANNHNDENTLIVHSGEIANIYRQEFEARWCENLPSDCYVNTVEEFTESPHSLFTLYPNPAMDEIHLKLKEQNWEKPIVITLFDSSGHMLKSVVDQSGGGERTLDIGDLPAQNYFLQLRSGEKNQTLPLIIQR